MVQKQKKRPRGRPRSYDVDTALRQATDAFWDLGYSGTTLDDLSTAMGMNRPSLYSAFGDKHALYVKSLGAYRAFSRVTMQEELSYDLPLADALRRVYARAISIYESGRHGPRGCYLLGTAATEAVLDIKIRKQLADGLQELDDLLEARLKYAIEHGELKTSIEPAALARVACGLMNSLALRARAGDSRATLKSTAEAGIRLLCGDSY
jgi:TetR/AcrR family transcriptional regulator, copper-responsive repressor